MKNVKVVLLSVIALGLVFSSAFAAGDAAMGKVLFDDPKAFGGQVSCASCHPDGKGLEKSGEKGKKMWSNPGGKWLKLQDAINVCIVMANKGKAIDPHSADMKNLVAYIKSLGMKSMPAEMPMKSGY